MSCIAGTHNARNTEVKVNFLTLIFGFYVMIGEALSISTE